MFRYKASQASLCMADIYIYIGSLFCSRKLFSQLLQPIIKYKRATHQGKSYDPLSSSDCFSFYDQGNMMKYCLSLRIVAKAAD